MAVTSETRPGRRHSQVVAHEQGDGDGQADREDAPGRLGQGVDDHQREHGQDDDHDREDRDQCGDPAHHADLLANHLTQALAVAAHREEEHHHVLHGAGQDDADDDPDRAGQVAHLGGEHRTDERARPGDRGEVVPEQHVPMGDVEVTAVVVPLRRCGPGVVDPEHPVGDEAGVEAIGDGVRGQGREEDPEGRDLLPAGEREDGPADGADDGDRAPDGHRLRRHAGRTTGRGRGFRGVCRLRGHGATPPCSGAPRRAASPPLICTALQTSPQEVASLRQSLHRGHHVRHRRASRRGGEAEPARRVDVCQRTEVGAAPGAGDGRDGSHRRGAVPLPTVACRRSPGCVRRAARRGRSGR